MSMIKVYEMHDTKCIECSKIVWTFPRSREEVDTFKCTSCINKENVELELNTQLSLNGGEKEEEIDSTKNN